MTPELRQAIRDAYQAGALKVQAVDTETGEVSLYPCAAVLKHCTSSKGVVRTILGEGQVVETTEDHSLFYKKGRGIREVEAGKLQVGDALVVVRGGQVTFGVAVVVERLPPQEFTYDLSVPGPQNFMLSNGILAHNSYSIGGVSLDIERSSKYESLKQNAESQFEKAQESKARTTKFIRGLRQPRFGAGARSAFGPYTGSGVMSPRKFLAVPWLFFQFAVGQEFLSFVGSVLV